MKLSREDVLPLVAILAAGSLGVAITSSALHSRHEHVSVLRFEYSSPSAEWRATQRDRAQPRTPRSLRGVLEEVDGLRERQRLVRERVRDLPTGPADRRTAIVELRIEKDGMVESLEDIGLQIERAFGGELAGGSTRRGLEARAVGDLLAEKVRYSRGTIEVWDPQSADAIEEDIEADLRTLREELRSIERVRRSR